MDDKIKEIEETKMETRTYCIGKLVHRRGRIVKNEQQQLEIWRGTLRTYRYITINSIIQKKSKKIKSTIKNVKTLDEPTKEEIDEIKKNSIGKYQARI